MILGEICTRNCTFCATQTGRPFAPNLQEPDRLAESICLMQLKHAVITSVTRDDLPDGGAQHWSHCITAVRRRNPNTTIEVLIPDFNGNEEDIQTVLSAAPNIVSHNLETVERLTPLIRNRATYRRSLSVLETMASSGILTKTGFMVGLGETSDEVKQTIVDAKRAGCSTLTIGQYLQPTKEHASVVAYITPETFDAYKAFALAQGFTHVESAPLVRSSYHAELSLL